MAILFPSWATPVLDVYNVPWPDIDEDTILDLGTRVADIGEAIDTFNTSVHGALVLLSSRTESAAFESFVEEWDSTANAFITPIRGTAEAAIPITQIAHGAVTTAKTAILAVLAAQIASTFAGPLSAAIRLAAKELIEAAVEEAIKLAAAAVMNEVNGAIENTIIQPMKDFVGGAVQEVSFSVKQVVVDATPSLGTVSDQTMQLAIDIYDVTVAAEQVKDSFVGIQEAVGHLAKWQAGSGYSSPAPYPDPLLRDILKPVLDHLVETVHNEINDLGYQIINKLAQNLIDTWERLSTADTVLEAEVRRLRNAATIPLPNHVHLIDRSAIPELIAIQMAAAPVKTGAGHSDAREGVQQIVIERAAAPVVTGPAQSDARENIREIVIERAPDPVTVGPGVSAARENIQEIVIERAPEAVVTGSADSDARERIQPLARPTTHTPPQ